MNSMRTKTCSKCESNLPLSQFFKDKKNRDGYCNRCKSCKGGKSHWKDVGGKLNSPECQGLFKEMQRVRVPIEFFNEDSKTLLTLMKELSSTRYFSIQVDKENVAIHTHEKNRSSCLKGELKDLEELLKSLL